MSMGISSNEAYLLDRGLLAGNFGHGGTVRFDDSENMRTRGKERLFRNNLPGTKKRDGKKNYNKGGGKLSASR
jgi:hypothetical protein